MQPGRQRGSSQKKLSWYKNQAAVADIGRRRLPSHEKRHQSCEGEASQQHRPIPCVEAQEPTVTREAQCHEPLHRGEPLLVESRESDLKRSQSSCMAD